MISNEAGICVYVHIPTNVNLQIYLTDALYHNTGIIMIYKLKIPKLIIMLICTG